MVFAVETVQHADLSVEKSGTKNVQDLVSFVLPYVNLIFCLVDRVV